MENKYAPYLKKFGSYMGIIGTIGLLIIDWKIGIIVFLMLWAHNLEYHS